MFTGLVQAMGEVIEVQTGPAGLRLRIQSPGWTPTEGDSICVSGVCLTQSGPSTGGVMTFTAIPETLAATTLGSLRPGHRVNLERSLAVGDLMGGHTVQGHIDAIGTVDGVHPSPDDRLVIRPPVGFMKFVVPKGSIAVDGVSLTIAAVQPDTFTIALIPTTLERTTLAALKPGDRCNLESDILARTIVHYLQHFRR
jgi:riboflavin synthase